VQFVIKTAFSAEITQVWPVNITENLRLQALFSCNFLIYCYKALSFYTQTKRLDGGIRSGLLLMQELPLLPGFLTS
jgi:hypothetical protein